MEAPVGLNEPPPVNEHSDPPPQPWDIWEALQRHASERDRTSEHQDGDDAADEGANPGTSDGSSTSRIGIFKWIWIADVLGLLFWIYLLVGLLIVDVDRLIAEQLPGPVAWLFVFKAIPVALVMVIIGLFFWRLWALLFLLYVVMFPLVVLAWKLPYFVYRARSAILVLMGLHGVALMLKEFRYHFITKPLWFLAAAGILFTDSPMLLATGALLVSCLLFWSFWRTIAHALRPNWFLGSQTDLIMGVMNSSAMKQFVRIEDDLKTRDRLTEVEASQVALYVTKEALLNRALYWWAYQLQQYKASYLTAVFNGAAYFWLILETVAAFWLLNLALLEANAAQYTYGTYPSSIGMLVYSFSTIALNDGAGISSDGNLGHLLRLAAGACGLVLVATFGMGMLVHWRRERDVSSLDETVADLKSRARQHGKEFELELHVGVSEAVKRLEELGTGMHFLVTRLVSGIPADFLEEPADGD